MKFIFYSPVHFEKWDWRNSVEKGIGGSETSHVEMAWRLAARGHEVVTYAPLPDDCPGEWRNTKWFPIEQADFSQAGVWIIYRAPEAIDKFDHTRTDQTLWFMMQDWSYPSMTKERAEHLDKMMTLCCIHGRDTVKEFPYLKDKMWITSNAAKQEMVLEIEKENIVRNPKKIIYASSPDRGLLHLLSTFKKAREIVPDLELHAFYGFNNLQKLIDMQGEKSYFKGIKEQTEELLKQPGVYWRGRVSQQELYREWFSAGMWVYQTNFNETSCITSMEAQSMGAIPIVNPIYALAENVLHGVIIEGDAYNDPLTRVKYTAEIVRMAVNPELQESIRGPMMQVARERFTWERMVDQWIAEADGKAWSSHEFPFQLNREKEKE